MFYKRRGLLFPVILTLFNLIPAVHAESIKFVHWWDEYLPNKKEFRKVDYTYMKKSQVLHHQDVNNDGIQNDSLVCKPFDTVEMLNPLPQCNPTDPEKWKEWMRYRLDRPSARFYGGMVTRFPNVSHLTEKNSKGEDAPIFDRVDQASVQPTEGAARGFYDPAWPHNIGRGGSGPNWGERWADMTYFVVGDNGPKLSALEEGIVTTEGAGVSFSSVFIWKKADFVNGGAQAPLITFDATSRLSFDITRKYAAVEEGRFVVQDGEQFWISEGRVTSQNQGGNKILLGEQGIEIESSKKGGIVKLNPLNTRWANYTPTACEIALNRDAAQFETHVFTDVQAVGVYLATYNFFRPGTEETEIGFAFDNFQAYATSQPSANTPRDTQELALAVDTQGNFLETDAKFLTDLSVNNQTVTLHPTDKTDIRGVITVDSHHVDKEADIIVVVGYKPTADAGELFFMFNKDGTILPWDGDMSKLVALEDGDKYEEGEGFSKKPIVLKPERYVQLFPVSVDSFKETTESMDTIVLGCAERPLTYSGFLKDVPPGFLRFFYGYRLREEGTLVFNGEGVNIVITP